MVGEYRHICGLNPVRHLFWGSIFSTRPARLGQSLARITNTSPKFFFFLLFFFSSSSHFPIASLPYLVKTTLRPATVTLRIWCGRRSLNGKRWILALVVDLFSPTLEVELIEMSGSQDNNGGFPDRMSLLTSPRL